MRIRTVLGVVALAALSPGCALPCVALHNIRVEMRDNWDEEMTAFREWWHRDRGFHQPRFGVTLRVPEPALPLVQKDERVVDGPPLLPPPSPGRGDEKPQAVSPYNGRKGIERP